MRFKDFVKKILVIFFMIIFLWPKNVFANGAGLPAFFEINGKLAISNPLQAYGITASSFLIPQDLAPENYLINQTIDFKVDEPKLQVVIPEDTLKNAKYLWDFGDGSKAEGLKNTHQYSKEGSYILILTINIYTQNSQTPIQFIDSFLLNILPDGNFNKLPQAVIRMNGSAVKDSLKNGATEVNFADPVTFDASDSKIGSSPVIEYMWNFGDGQTGNGPKLIHKYSNKDFITVVLRIKDRDGFISYAFVGLENNPNIKTRVNFWKNYTPYIVATLLILGGGIFILLRRRA